MAEYLKSGEVAQLLGVAASTLAKWGSSGIFVPERVLPSGHRLYSRAQVQDFMDEHGMSKYSKDEVFMTRREAAEYIGVSVSLLRLMEEREDLVPSRRLPGNGKRLYAKSDIDAFVERTANR